MWLSRCFPHGTSLAGGPSLFLAALSLSLLSLWFLASSTPHSLAGIVQVEDPVYS